MWTAIVMIALVAAFVEDWIEKITLRDKCPKRTAHENGLQIKRFAVDSAAAAMCCKVIGK